MNQGGTKIILPYVYRIFLFIRRIYVQFNRFAEVCGSYICNDLLGCDVRTEEGVKYCFDNNLFTEFCPKMVANAVDVLKWIYFMNICIL